MPFVPHLTDENTEAQRRAVTCLGSPGSWWQRWDSERLLGILTASHQSSENPSCWAWQGALTWPYLKLQLSVPFPAGSNRALQGGGKTLMEDAANREILRTPS